MDEHPGLVYEKASLSTIQKAKLEFPTVSNNPIFWTKKTSFWKKTTKQFHIETRVENSIRFDGFMSLDVVNQGASESCARLFGL